MTARKSTSQRLPDTFAIELINPTRDNELPYHKLRIGGYVLTQDEALAVIESIQALAPLLPRASSPKPKQ